MSYRVLFVCLGNICRSPTAEGVFRKLLRQQDPELVIEIDSAGTCGYHVGETPDPRAQSAAKNKGYDLSAIRGRQVSKRDFEYFDYILAMDESNYQNLVELAPANQKHKISLFLSYSENDSHSEVPDPYYGGERGFDLVIELIEQASQGLIKHLQQKRES